MNYKKGLEEKCSQSTTLLFACPREEAFEACCESCPFLPFILTPPFGSLNLSHKSREGMQQGLELHIKGLHVCREGAGEGPGS